jgi:peptidyl-prolyl cis-trans isomerase SurA
MTLRISKFAAVCGLSLLALPGVVQAQAPRYQSPYAVPSAPQPQLTLPTSPAITPNGTVVEDVIARVNDQIISRSDLERSEIQLAQELQQSNASPSDSAQRQKDLLRDKIDQQLLLSRGKELGLNADAEVIRRLDEIRKQNHLDSMEDLEKAARSQGVSFEDFKANIHDAVITQQVVRDEVGRRLQMTQSQENAYYDQHKKEFEQPEQIRLSEILVPTPADAKDDVVAQAQAKANDVAAKLQGGSKFEELAKTYSGGQTATQGGDLGLFKRGALAKILEDKTFDLKAGESTAPIRTRQGFVILKVTEHVDAGVPPLKDIEPQIQEAMYMDQLQPALRAYLMKLREEAYIDIKPGFVDTGASSKQTKPVFTAYTAPVVKKKKVQQKQRFDRGGRFSTASAGAGKPVVANPPPTAATSGTTKVATGKKQKKVKREKVRFGQAPRNSLPAGPQEVAGAVGTPGAAAAPGTAIAPLETDEIATASDVDPMAPKPVVTGKTRFSSREKELKAAKKAKQVAKVKEKAIETPAPMTAEETSASKTQAAPLGLNGDTAKKKKKKKEKGAPKERLQQKEKAPPAPAPEAMPYRTPKPDAPATPAPSSDNSTMPATTTPQTPSSPPPAAPPQN